MVPESRRDDSLREASGLFPSCGGYHRRESAAPADWGSNGQPLGSDWACSPVRRCLWATGAGVTGGILGYNHHANEPLQRQLHIGLPQP
ncbi:hypothetical protein NDU88_008277 [Pleurodeles waltl]|uniref:Uncharacterized protein n=1 Tax=Pleurodeles waltl TaxID=8319 RepID=A0AAV7PP26_PLEWA|nr:hypothetical protein NDU88_008277 [Pleurodeles waltl]